MKVSATGWRRDMGPNPLGKPDLRDIRISDGPPDEHNTNETYIYRSGDSIKIAWHATIRLTGDYLVELEIEEKEIEGLSKRSKEDIDDLMDDNFKEVEKEYGVPAPIFDIKLGELVAMISKIARA